MKRNYFSVYSMVFITSSFIIASEVLLSRIFALLEGQNYTSLIISLALMGFGISGTILTLIKKRIEKSIPKFFDFSIALYIFSLPLSFFLYAVIPLNTLEILWDAKQAVFFFLHFLVLLIPFTTGSLLLAISFLLEIKISNIYFSNLAGSAAGGIIALVLMNFFHPYNAFVIFLILYLISFGINLLITSSKKTFLIYIPSLILIILIFCISISGLRLLEYSQYKGISSALRLPNSKIILSKITPYGIIQVVEADGLRRVNGLSYNYTGDIPVQKGIYIDGNQAGMIIPYNGKDSIEYLNWCSQALSCFLLEQKDNKSLLIIGMGGGEGVLRGIYNGFSKIIVLENNRWLIEMMKNELSEYSGNIFNLQYVRAYNIEPRNFLRSTSENFDIIEISLYDSYVTSTIPSLSENYIYTVESFYEMYKRLSPDGILSITRWAIYPMNDAIKLFVTAEEMLQRYKIPDYKKKIAFIRSANTATLCISKSNISVEKVKEFCKKMSFDPIYYYGITPQELNKHFRQKGNLQYETIENILSDRKKAFIKAYPYDIRPAEDKRPYYYNFFRLKTFKIIKQSIQSMPFHEWGYGVLIILLIPVFLISLILILIPVIIFYRKESFPESSKRISPVVIYFFIIGIAYFFVEIPLIQKMILFLAYPVYSFSIVLTSMLFFTGLGSYFSGRFKPKTKRIFIFLIPPLLIFILFINLILKDLSGLTIAQRFLFTVFLTGLPAFFMGFPFPSFLESLKVNNPDAIPIAWGVNGFASVISSLSASILGIIFGLDVVMVIAAILYSIAGVLFRNYFYSSGK